MGIHLDVEWLDARECLPGIGQQAKIVYRDPRHPGSLLIDDGSLEVDREFGEIKWIGAEVSHDVAVILSMIVAWWPIPKMTGHEKWQ